MKEDTKTLIEACLSVTKRRMHLNNPNPKNLIPCWCQTEGPVCINQPQCELVRKALNNLKVND